MRKEELKIQVEEGETKGLASGMKSEPVKVMSARGGIQNKGRGRGEGKGLSERNEIRVGESNGARGGIQNKGRGRGGGKGLSERNEIRVGESNGARGGIQNKGRGRGGGKGLSERNEIRVGESNGARVGIQNKGRGRGGGKGLSERNEIRVGESNGARVGILNKGRGRAKGKDYDWENETKEGKDNCARRGFQNRESGSEDAVNKTDERSNVIRGQTSKQSTYSQRQSETSRKTKTSRCHLNTSQKNTYYERHGATFQQNPSVRSQAKTRGNDTFGQRHTEALQENKFGRNAHQGIGYNLIRTWSKINDSEEMLVRLCSDIESLKDFMMDDTMNEDCYCLLVHVINSAISCEHNTQTLKRLLDAVCTSHLLTQMLSNYFDQIHMHMMNSKEMEVFTNSIMSIIKHILTLLPENAHTLKLPLRILQLKISGIEPVNLNLEESITSLTLAVTKVRLDRIEHQKATKSYQPCSDSETPPEDFRQLSVIPTISDLSTDVKPFVRAIITKGVYRDQEHYLDILFRLMREDFVKPLRSGIQEYREHINDKNFKNSHLRLYHGVHFTGMTHVNGINHVVQFDVSNMKHVKWDHSKQLLNGNLLCLSNDNFQSTLIFATVSFRDIRLLRKGIINIVCHTGMNVALKSSPDDTFVMAETMAYYEAVHPILKGLQAIDSDLPLGEYIITCQKQLKPPTYLLKEVRMYDLSCMMKTPNSTNVPVLNPLRWPPTESMCLNACQREAAILALTKEISIIQGPPGTGKTFVGLKVIQALLGNRDRMLPNDDSNSDCDPILVICYTNHALDQFLEGVLDICHDGVIRVGGNQSSDRLKPFNLMTVAKQRKEKSGSSNRLIHYLYTRLDEHCKTSKQMKNELDSLRTDVLSEHDLSKHIAKNHYASLVNGMHRAGRKSKIHQWLNAPNKTLFQALSEMIKHHMTRLVMEFVQLHHIADWEFKFSVCYPIIERVKIYTYWLRAYQHSLLNKMKTQRDSRHMSSRYHRSLQPFILEDSEICGVISKKDNEKMKRFLEKTTVIEGNCRIVENWVLGLHNECHKQMDDFEVLRNFIKTFYCHEENNEDNFDDNQEVKEALNKREFFEDEGSAKKHLSATLDASTKGTFLWRRALSLGLGENYDISQKANFGDHHGFKAVANKKPYTFPEILFLLSGKQFSSMDTAEEDKVDDVWKLSMQKRYALYKLWVDRYREDLVYRMDEIVQNYNETKQELTEAHMRRDVKVLRQARVIGMTTTGAAKKRAWLEAVGCRIIIVEEAAEVLEAHIVTALNKNCKHLILIGDHKQLRPNPTVYEHAEHFGLDVSLFERLVNNGIPHVTLREQHRMRESISVIMRHIYPSLEDHISVKNYENIRGVSKNIFFIQHYNDEAIIKDSRSKSNPFEAEYLVRLCKYFLLQGYLPSQIAILATYGGQVFALKKEMLKCNFTDEVRITTVDNFQGEESDIVLLSLVRSNKQNIAGFLKVNNRVCVALSRAKKGMFVIGNITLLASQSELWRKIKETAESGGITGDGLPIACPNHPDEKKVLKIPKDFDFCPEGGCLKKCNVRLDCGHICRLTCHGYDAEHKNIKCLHPCTKSCPERHPCRKQCWEECGPCLVRVDKEISACGHSNVFSCSKIPMETDCYSQCETTLPCGHRCTGKCGKCKQKDTHKQCKVPVTYTWPCDHAVEVPCFYKPTENPCPKLCGEILHCGHKCAGNCSDCLRGAIHVACKEKCGKTLLCGHTCQSMCSIPCPPCSLPCPAACRHGRCSPQNKSHLCGELCSPCDEPCLNICQHRRCSRKCHEKCDVAPCGKRCQKILSCGHRCSGLCGEMCVCRECQNFFRINELQKAVEEINSSIVQNRNNNLLMVIPSCRHTFILGEIDESVACMAKTASVRFLCCPKCSNPMGDCHRYQKILKERHAARQNKKKLTIRANIMSAAKTQVIRDSIQLVKDSDHDDIWRNWDILEVSYPNGILDLQTLSLKLRFAYVINAIFSLSQEASFTSDREEIQKRVSVLLRMRNDLSFQQIKEFEVDLKRLLLHQYFIILKSFADRHGIAESTKMCGQVQKILSRARPSTHLFPKVLDVLKNMRKTIQNNCPDSVRNDALLSAKTIVKRTLDVLHAANGEALKNIACRSNARTQRRESARNATSKGTIHLGSLKKKAT